MYIEKWKMDYEKHIGLDCTIPCTMYGTLLEHGIIDDPFYAMNDQKYTQLSEKDCIFYSSFTADEELLKKDYIYLNFYGLDTLCDIFINDKKIAYTSDMHRMYSFDVKKLLVRGENTLKVAIKSPIKYAEKMNNEYFLWNGKDTISGVAHLRKSLCMSGWDWSPKLPDMGIFREVEVDAYNTDKIDDVAILQYHENGKVRLEISAATKHNSNCDIYFYIDKQRVKLINGTAEVIIENPRLWWARGYGEQYLYDTRIELSDNNSIIDIKEQRIGLRTLTISTERDADDVTKGEFCFVNNGVKIFAMGANYVPQDNLLSRIDPEKIKELIFSCVYANYNCIRIWGGGYFPNEEFYDLCDELGIIVWQDFMSACYPFRLTDEYKENFKEEAVYNIKRLRNRASLGLFCGNNELEWNFERYENAIDSFKSQLLRNDYIEVFERMLPSLCKEYAPQTFYWPSSPSSNGGFAGAEEEETGDVHFYSPLPDYSGHKFRFCSEYGFQSFPSMKTIRSFAEEKDLNCFSRVMENHQKSGIGNKTLLGYIAENYLAPYSFENLVYASQLFQAKAVSDAVQYFRSIRGICMGSIYWQFNDCAPVASWSSVDYYGRYKALHYAAKRFYAPIAIGIFAEKGKIRINLSNETREKFSGVLTISVCRNDMSVIEKREIKVSAPELSSKDVFADELTLEDKYSNYIYVTLFDDIGKEIASQSMLCVKPKHFEFKKPDFSVHFTKNNDDVSVIIKSDVFAMGVYLDFDEFDCIFSDNFFDIGENKEYVITFKSDKKTEELEKSLKIKSVYDIGV